MLDKIDKLKTFPSNLYKSYNFLRQYLNSSTGSLILIGVNTPFALKYFEPLFNSLKVTKPSFRDIEDKGSLGGFLRWELSCSNSKEGDRLLVLDYFDQLAHSISDEQTFAYKMNGNRDLFRKLYFSTIVVVPLNIVAAIRHYAVDFWSCLDIYIDTTKWFCNPVLLPIIQVRTLSNTNNQFVDLYKQNETVYYDYIKLKSEIVSSNIYSHKTFDNILKKINSHEGLCYVDAMYHFVRIMTTNQAKYDTNQSRIFDLRSLQFKNEVNSLALIDLYLMLAEFFFKSGEYNDAYNLYERCRNIVTETMSKDFEQHFILCLIKCNKVICRYMRDGVHNPRELVEHLEYFLPSDLPAEYKDFFNTYLLLVSYTAQHHSYAQHQDICDRLKNIKMTFLPNINYDETYFSLLQWEEGVANNFAIINGSQKSQPILAEIIFNIQKMIHYYCQGDYSNARKYYKTVRKIARQYSYIQIYDILELTIANMRYMMAINNT